MIETLFAIILTPIAVLAAAFTIAIGIGAIKGLVKAIGNLRN